MSNAQDEQSEGGSKILRHAASEESFSPVTHAAEHLEDIQAHVQRHVGEVETVFHEILSDLVHLDVLFVPATDERPYHLLVTSGVSDEPMAVPDGLEEHRRVELLMALPKEWPLTQEAFADEANYWPIRWLKQIGRLPHQYKTWIGWGHTIPNGDPAEPIANTRFTGVMLVPPYALPPEFFRLAGSSGDTISFFQLVPLYAEEMELKLKKGAEALEEQFVKRNIGFVVDPQRPNVAAKRRWFGIW